MLMISTFSLSQIFESKLLNCYSFKSWKIYLRNSSGELCDSLSISQPFSNIEYLQLTQITKTDFIILYEKNGTNTLTHGLTIELERYSYCESTFVKTTNLRLYRYYGKIFNAIVSLENENLIIYNSNTGCSNTYVITDYINLKDLQLKVVDDYKNTIQKLVTVEEILKNFKD